MKNEGIKGCPTSRICDEDEKIAPPTYPNPIYLSYDEVEWDKWYDVREFLPSKGFKKVVLEVQLDTEAYNYVIWVNKIGAFQGVPTRAVKDNVAYWRLY
jgi:hypothetical protein